MSRVFLLGVPIDRISKAEAIVKIKEMLQSEKQHHVMTPNSEMLVEAHRNSKFKEVLNASALNLPDSQGVVWFGGLPERVTGVDTVVELCHELREDQPVFLLGAAEGVAPRAASVLLKNNPRLRIAGTFAGSPSDTDVQDIIDRINKVQPHLLLVAYGAPKQDLWIAQHLAKMPSVKVAMGVGGTFDFLAGKRKRAPKIFQRIGLEWLWRLLLEPKRWKRIGTAVIVFPLMVFSSKFQKV